MCSNPPIKSDRVKSSASEQVVPSRLRCGVALAIEPLQSLTDSNAHNQSNTVTRCPLLQLLNQKVTIILVFTTYTSGPTAESRRFKRFATGTTAHIKIILVQLRREVSGSGCGVGQDQETPLM